MNFLYCAAIEDHFNPDSSADFVLNSLVILFVDIVVASLTKYCTKTNTVFCKVYSKIWNKLKQVKPTIKKLQIHRIIN